MTRSDLRELFFPVPLEDFLRDHAFKRPLVVPGELGKFRTLFTWDSLNQILSYTRYDPLRVHLDRVGTHEGGLPFTHLVVNVRGEQLPRVDPRLLYQHLREGATLVVDGVNEVDSAVAALSEELAGVLSAPTATTVLFASFGHTPGFAVHWDNRDVYALQIEGRKHWRIHEPTRAAPLSRGDEHVLGSGEPGELYWEGTLESGDLLYIPRGWWHEVTSMDAPSLHLNVGFAPVTALDVAEWVMQGLREKELMRVDLPQFSPEDLEAHERAVRELLGAAMADLSLRRFLTEIGARARRQVHVSLPHGVDPGSVPLRQDQSVRFSTSTAAVLASDGTCRLAADGIEIQVPAAAAPMLYQLVEGGDVTLAELEAGSPGLDPEQVTEVVGRLLGAGLLYTVPCTSST